MRLLEAEKAINETIGKNLKHFRRNTFVRKFVRGKLQSSFLTQGQLAKGIGVTFQQIQKYEWGVNRLSASKLKITANFLGIPVQDLYNENQDQTYKKEITL